MLVIRGKECKENALLKEWSESNLNGTYIYNNLLCHNTKPEHSLLTIPYKNKLLTLVSALREELRIDNNIYFLNLFQQHNEISDSAAPSRASETYQASGCYSGSDSRALGATPVVIRGFKDLRSERQLNLQYLKIKIVGHTGWKYRKSMRIIKKQKNIEYLGYVKDSELVQLINKANLIIYPSRSEGFGLPIIESLSCGTPVLANDLSVFREIYGNNIFYFKYPDKKQILKKVNYIFSLNSVEYSKLRKKCMNFSKKFTWEKTAKETMKVYI